MFVTKYVPTQARLDDKNKAFEGSVSTQSKDSFTTVGIDDGGGTNDDSPDIHYSEYYPDDCDGWVNETTVIAEYSCGCGHWPGDSTCQGCITNEPQWAGYAYVTTYECIPYDTSNPNDNGTDTTSTNPGGVTNDTGPSNEEGSIAVLVRDEDEPCENPPPGDLNGDCIVNIKDCVLAGNSPQICHCTFNGGTEEECDKGCKQLKYSISDHPTIKTRLNQLTLASGNNEKGLRVDKRPTTDEYEPTPILDNSSGSNHINIIVNPYTAVIAHTHPNDVFYKMFSAPDILKMAQIAKKIQSDQSISASTVEFTEITHILIFENSPGQHRTYALRFDDEATVNKLLNILNNSNRSMLFNKELKKAYESDHNYNTAQPETDIFKQQQHLFNLLEDYNLNISLYEANYDANNLIDNWAKINKDTLEQEPCN
ncbi:hypothetical protein [Winogradskyella sp. PG-2]|uniref:hypothetical protein n=1 Tax=Winogradskyella sp. PG-2 TaxID=754409 RepID=UPI00045890CD|nr:hypothetical protein [Winogradskyella sp. PG-2]BAO75847.1 hypothetical protein WPG_1617 [Winogradskyella sp. PG-2]